MPPAAFVAAATCSISTSSTTSNMVLTFLTPATTKPGDTLLIAVMTIDPEDGAIDTGRLPIGWSVVATYGPTQLGQITTILRRLATDAEPPSHAIPLTGLAIAGGALLVYRGLDGGAALVDGGIADVNLSPAFPCPSLTLTTYSDLYVGIAWISNGSAPVTPPSGTTMRLDVAQTPFGFPCECAVFELLTEATGPTGAQTATTTPLHSGIAVAVALKTLPPLPAPAITPDVPGAIGFVTVGV